MSLINIAFVIEAIVRNAYMLESLDKNQVNTSNYIHMELAKKMHRNNHYVWDKIQTYGASMYIKIKSGHMDHLNEEDFSNSLIYWRS